MNIQSLFEGLSQQWARERAATQLTLGKLIAELEKMPTDTSLPYLMDPHSYRGYYEDLAFELWPGTTTAGELLAICNYADGRRFSGYKGGEFKMHCDTPLWVADYGCCGEKLISISASEGITTQPDED